MDEDKKNFEAMVSILKLRDYDFLDYRLTYSRLASLSSLFYRNTKFDIDFADFNRKICNLTEKVKFMFPSSSISNFLYMTGQEQARNNLRRHLGHSALFSVPCQVVNI